MTKILGLLICWGMMLVPCAVAESSSLAPTFWKQRLFYIPYQFNQRGKLRDPITKVQLLFSRTGANDWATLEEAEPNVQGFSYHAPADGEYWFALRHLDRRGRPWPSAAVQPQMRLVVDTIQPEISIDGSLGATGEMILRYEARDENLQLESLRIEIKSPSGKWSVLRLGKPDVAQSDRLVGRARWRAPMGGNNISIRATIADQAGHRATAEKTVATTDAKVSPFGSQALEGPSLSSPTLSNSNTASDMLADPFQRASKLPSHDWPANNRMPSSKPSRPIATQPPPPSNPYTIANQSRPNRTHAQLIGDGSLGTTRDAAPQTLQVTPLGPGNSPSLPASTPWPSAANSDAAAKASQGDWTPARPANDEASRVVNSRTFDVEYDLQSVGPWGVSKVELWGTHDNGQTWRSFGVDPDNRSPIRVSVPGAGQFGFRILVDGANSAGSAPPQAGDEPELVVAVDLQPPTAELLAADLGQGNLSDHLLVRWTATDTNLEPRPIALFYSSYPNGPWSTIASGLENTGSYTWRIERHVPGRFYLRLEARDVAGNLATFQTPSPIALARPQPTGRLRSVRPIGGE